MDALYFPHLSLPPSTWVNPALLFFDRLGVIAPAARPPELFDRRMHELLDRDMAVQMIPMGPWNGSDEDERFTGYLLGMASAPPEIRSFERIHAGS